MEGNVSRYLPERVQKAEAALWNEPFPRTATSFLASRYAWGKDADFIRKFHVGLEPNSWGKPAILFPMKSMEGSWFYTLRSILEGPKYMHEQGTQPPLYLPLPPQEEVVYLCEGHSDTLTARWLGYPAMGLMGTSSWKQHLDYLRQFREVRVVMDADRAGWKTAGELFVQLCNARLIFLHGPEVNWPAEQFRMLTKTVPYCDLKLDLSDVALQYGPAWTRVLMERSGGSFGPGHRDAGWPLVASCSTCGAQPAERPRPFLGQGARRYLGLLGVDV